MVFTYTKDLIYKNCSRRIDEKIREKNKEKSKNKNISHRKLYPPNPKIIGRILRCETDKRNPYLIQYAVLCEVRDKLDFDSNQEILWGSHEEIALNLPLIFQQLILDLLSPSSEYKDEIDNILCRYVPYARYSAYYHLLFESESPIPGFHPSDFYNVNEFEAKMNIDAMADKAIVHLFSLCKDNFFELFLTFTDSHDTFKFWDDEIKKWVNEYFIKMLECYTPTSNALGTRIRNIINSDYLYIPSIDSITNQSNPNAQSMKDLLSATEKYIQELEKIQANCIDQNLFC
jgi:hypothetical protein